MLVLRLLSLSFSGFCCCYALLFSRVLRYSLLFCVFFRSIYFFRARTQYALPGALLLYFQCVCVLFCSAHNRWLTYSAFVVLHNDSQPGFAAL